MPGKRSADKSTTGVTMLDVLQCLEYARRDYPDGNMYICLEENSLGGFFLGTYMQFRAGDQLCECETTEPWTPVKGRLEAFVYRSCIDTMKEADRQLARLQAGHTAR